jgi:retron-type reverse transcriptase
MKRCGYLWDGLISLRNLFRAAAKARRGKRDRSDVAAFHLRLEPELLALRDELAAGAYRPGPYRCFLVADKKPRLIAAAPYRDRVVHHALCNVLEPLWERSFDPDSYACRRGKGSHAAMRRAQQLARRSAYVWKADVRKFFPSVDRAVLRGLLARRVKDAQVLDLAGRILDGGPPPDEPAEHFPGDDLFAPAERPRGLPIGNQTSQFFANVYLDPLDHALRRVPGVRGLVRYCDDFLVFAADKVVLHAARRTAEACLGRLRLRLHPDKNTVLRTRDGLPFVGYRVFPTHVKLAADNVRRFRRRLRDLADRYARHEVEWPAVCSRVNAWLGHARQADTWTLRWRLLTEQPFRRTEAL